MIRKYTLQKEKKVDKYSNHSYQYKTTAIYSLSFSFFMIIKDLIVISIIINWELEKKTEKEILGIIL